MTLWTIAALDELQPMEVSTASGPVTLAPSGLRLGLDENHAPYASARVTLPRLDAADLDKITPYADPAPLVTFTTTADPAAVAWTFVLHEVRVDADSGEVTLELVGGEAHLIDAGNVSAASDLRAHAHETSLRAIIDAVLADYGGVDDELAPGGPDADFTVTWDVTNELNNPSFETNVNDWRFAGGVSSIFRSTDITAQSGAAHLRANLTGSTAFITAGASTTTYRASEGKEYSFSFYARAAAIGRTIQARIEWLDEASNVISLVDSTALTLPTSPWTRVVVTATAPVGTRYIAPTIRYAGASNGEVLVVDAAMLHEGPPVPYFDGSTAASPYYVHAWTGAAHASPSTRTRLDDRARDVLDWKPGQSAWDFLHNLVAIAGYRLYWDPAGNPASSRWHLVDPAAPSALIADPIHVVAGYNALGGSDLRSLQAVAPSGRPLWCSGVVIRYRWIDGTGQQREEFDAAGTPRKVWLLDVDAPYPGPGAAAAALARAQRRSRSQEVTARIDLAAAPGGPVVIELPDVPRQSGVISAVTFEWHADSDRHDEMTIRARDLGVTPDTAWILQPSGYEWDDVPVGQSWDEYETP